MTEKPVPQPAHGAAIPKPPSPEAVRDVGRQQAMLDDEWAPPAAQDAAGPAKAPDAPPR